MATIVFRNPNARARAAVILTFFVNGVIFANWVARIPAIQSDLNLSPGILGFALLGSSVGTLFALTLAGGLIARFGSRAVTFLGVLLLCLFLPLLALMPNAFALAAMLFLFGVALSLMDVAMNTAAVAVEAAAEKPLMSSFHATFSVGGLAGALMGVAMAGTVAPLPHFLLVSALGILLMVLAVRYLPADDGAGDAQSHVFQLPHPSLWGLGVIAFCSSIGEGAMADWSGVYMERVVGAMPDIAALGYAAFSLTMTVGRLLGDRVALLIPPARIVRGGGLVAAGGLLLAVLVPGTLTTLFGFAAVGAGLSIVIPMVFSAAGKISGLPAGSGIAGVATIGYAGFLAGPPVIGVIAEATSLRVAFLIVALLVVTLFMTGRELHAAAMREVPASG